MVERDCDSGDPSSIPGQDMFSRGALVEDGDDLGQVSSWFNKEQSYNFFGISEILSLNKVDPLHAEKERLCYTNE